MSNETSIDVMSNSTSIDVITNEKLLIEEIYHALGSHILSDLEANDIFSVKYTINHLINKIEVYYKNKGEK